VAAGALLHLSYAYLLDMTANSLKKRTFINHHTGYFPN